MRKLFGLAVLAAAAGATAVALTGGDARPEAPPPPPAPEIPAGALAYHAARIWADPAAEPLTDAWLVVADGQVAAVARDRDELPPLCEVVELGERVIFPGLVAADSTVTGRDGQGDHALGAHRRAIDSFDPWADWSEALRHGVTTVYLSADRNRLVGGRGAVVKTAGEERVLREETDLRVDLTPAAFRPPSFYRPPVPPTSESPLLPPDIQPASSRAGALAVLREQPAAARSAGDGFDPHLRALAAFLDRHLPLRVVAYTEGEVRGAVEIARLWGAPLILDGAWEAARVLGDTAADLVFQVPLIASTGDRPPDWKGPEPDALAGLGGRRIALAAAEGHWSWLLEAAAAAVGLGLDEAAARAGITSAAAEVLGVGDRVGRLAPGLDADFIALREDPLAPSAIVDRVWVSGRLVWDAERVAASDAVVIRAGTIWTGDGPPLIGGGEVLLQDGRIAAVGPRVAHPVGARILDAGPEAHLTPGLIDARSTLGVPRRPEDSFLLGLLGAGSRWREEWNAVARGGVTTLVPAPTSFARTGSRTQAVKTGAVLPEEAWIPDHDLVFFDLRGGDHAAREGDLRQVLDGGRRYADQWKKYVEERAKWEEEKAAKDRADRAEREKELRLRLATGMKAEQEEDESGEETAAVEEEPEQAKAVDPLNGTWEATIEHEALPEPIPVRMRMHHEGRRLVVLLSSSLDPAGEEQEIEGTYEDKRIHLEVPTEMGTVMVDGEIDAPDHMVVQVVLQGLLSIEFEAVRTEVEQAGAGPPLPRKKRKKEDGPAEPRIDWRQEGLRALFEGRAVAVVAAERADEIALAVRVFADYELPVRILGGDEAAAVADLLRARNVGVIVPNALVRRRDGVDRVPAAELAALGIPTAFRSDAGTGARFLPRAAALAVRRGLDPGLALRALTSGAADLLGIQDRVGRLRPGLDGDLVVWSGPPFDLRSRVVTVFCNGREVPKP
ncbi:MAG: hypothetical protein D6702_11555 [Planctomycetota bacterium]|nr:MAG: hypothetical protein D6702_11555 [Planctomycetota bacterium]